MTEQAAAEIAAEGLLEEPGAAFPSIPAPYREEGLQVFADHRMENWRIEAARAVAGGERAAHALIASV